LRSLGGGQEPTLNQCLRFLEPGKSAMAKLIQTVIPTSENTIMKVSAQPDVGAL
jgi:hypothetical protein